MGFDKDPDNVEVIKASLPGPNALRTTTKFLRDTDYCKDILLSNYNESGIDYIGEWHSHVCHRALERFTEEVRYINFLYQLL